MMQMPIGQNNYKSERRKRVHQIASMYQNWYGMHRKIAFSIALQQAPRKDETKRGNDHQLFEIEVRGAKKLYHLLHSGTSGYFYHLHDIVANKPVCVLKKSLKKLCLVEQGCIVGLTRQFPYVETLVYGGTADDFDRAYKNNQDKR